MKTKTGKIILFLVIAAVLFSAPSFFGGSKVSALDVTYPSIFGHSLNNQSSIMDYLCYFFSLGTALAFFVTIIVIAFGGIYYLISFGSGKFTSEGKEWIKAGIFGLLIVICATLIVSTINPTLASCSPLGALVNVIMPPSDNSTTGTTAGVNTYNEIPIGTLTETLLTRTINCYAFDQDGNPVDGDPLTTDDNKKLNGPTYLDHDRVDCISLLADGARAKSQVIATLSDAITNLMNECSCAGKCDDTCGGSAGCSAPPTSCPFNWQCQGACVGAACLQPPNTNDCCPQESGVIDPTTNQPLIDQSTGKDLSVKGQIEHGPITITVPVDGAASCATKKQDYAGLDEFRSQYNNDYSAIKAVAETDYKVHGKTVTIMNDGNCKPCVDSCVPCDASTLSPQDYNTCMQTYNTCEDDFQKCQNNLDKCKKNSPWGKLKLIDQLTYFEGKLKDMESDLNKDKNTLDGAKNELDGKSCYLATSYADLLKTATTTNKSDVAIFTQDAFSDPITEEKVSPAKYCQGFNYNNSSCLKQCDDECPDDSSVALSAYASCGVCQANDTDCLDKQETCIEKAYNNRPCTKGPDTSQKFNDSDKNGNVNPKSCIASCQKTCSDNCEAKYLKCSSAYNICQQDCGNNSECVLSNAGDCLFGAQGFVDCGQQASTSDPSNNQNCINRAYLCKDGSDEYAGYEDCTNSNKPDYSLTDSIGQIIVNAITGGSGNSGSPSADCSQDYSSSFFFDNPSCLKCQYPYNPAPSSSVCYDHNLYNILSNSSKSCQDLCPETTKCPSDSSCPNCPCNQIANQTYKFYVPNPSISDPNNPEYNGGNEGYSESDQTIPSANEITGPQCDSYSYNDDPLTFYCENSWWSDSSVEKGNNTPSGTAKICPKQEEVPVGQTVDTAEDWANNISNDIDNMDNYLQAIIMGMEKAGNAYNTSPIQDYCKCNAKHEDSSPICKTNCAYWDVSLPNVGLVCGCDFVPCNGKPCSQVADYLSEIWNDYRSINLYFIDFFMTMVKEPRSDILKELTYSRQGMDNCSLIGSGYDRQNQLLSCSRVEDEIISPINPSQITVKGKTVNNYCYGKNLGNLFSASLMDNWFCCQNFETQKTNAQ